ASGSQKITTYDLDDVNRYESLISLKVLCLPTAQAILYSRRIFNKKTHTFYVTQQKGNIRCYTRHILHDNRFIQIICPKYLLMRGALTVRVSIILVLMTIMNPRIRSLEQRELDD